MKKTSLFTLLLCLMGSASFAASIIGWVRDAATAIRIPGQKVYARDSMTTYLDSAVTDWHGDYSFTTPASLLFNKLIIYTTSCGSITRVTFDPYNNNNGVADFFICTTATPSYRLFGTVTLNGTANSGPVKLYLISKQYDPVVGDTTLTAIDSVTTSTSSYSKTFSVYPGRTNGVLLLKAALQTGHSNYSFYVPTYYAASLVWNGATTLGPDHFTGDTTNMDLSAGANPGGPGFIGGSVLLGANKTTAVGDPLAKRILILTNSAGKAIAYTYSDASGKFSFSNLATGTYQLSGDAWGKTNPALTVTLSSTNQRVTNIIFEENNKRFWGHFGGLSVGAIPSSLSKVYAYPNPATSYLRFAGLDKVSGVKTIVVGNVTGAVISRHTFAANAVAEISMSDLPGGTYTVQVQIESGRVNFVIVK